jgi:hypothetical protein
MAGSVLEQKDTKETKKSSVAYSSVATLSAPRSISSRKERPIETRLWLPED